MKQEMERSMANMPPELKEAARLSQLAKQSNDPNAQARANELARAAVNRGGPVIQQRFKETLAQMSQDPDVKARMAKEGVVMPPAEAWLGAGQPSPAETASNLNQTLQSQLADAQEGMKRMEEEQARLSEITKDPAQMLEFFHSQGWSEQDMQRMMIDPEFREQKMTASIEQKAGNAPAALAGLDQLVDKVDGLMAEIKDGQGGADWEAKLADVQRLRENLDKPRKEPTKEVPRAKMQMKVTHGPPRQQPAVLAEVQRLRENLDKPRKDPSHPTKEVPRAKTQMKVTHGPQRGQPAELAPKPAEAPAAALAPTPVASAPAASAPAEAAIPVPLVDVELLPGEAVVRVEVPVGSMHELVLEIAPGLVRVGPASPGAFAPVRAVVPADADADSAAASFSRKRQRLTVRLPR